jgi:uncharacterized protein (TIGR02147 family)
MTERTDSTPLAHTPSSQPLAGLLSPQAIQSLSVSPPTLGAASVSPDVYAFQDFRAYLTAWFQWKKQVQPHYSGAIFAKKAGFNSHTLLGMVIRGQRNLSATSIRAFCRALGLKGKEATYFEKLVLFNQARNSDDQAYYFEQLLLVSKNKGKAPIVWTHNCSAYLSHWYVVAIREMVAVKGFNPDPEWIVAKLKKRITRKQAEEAWNLLQALGMVSCAADGRWQIVNPLVEIDTIAIPGTLRNFNQEYLDLAKGAVAESPSASHEVTTLTLAIASQDLRKLMDRIYEFRQQINAEFSVTDREADQIVAVNTAVIALSEAEEN